MFLFLIPAIMRERVALSTMSGIFRSFSDLEGCDGKRITQEFLEMVKRDRSSGYGSGLVQPVGLFRNQLGMSWARGSRSHPVCPFRYRATASALTLLFPSTLGGNP